MEQVQYPTERKMEAVNYNLNVFCRFECPYRGTANCDKCPVNDGKRRARNHQLLMEG
jgi:hypothetical protein